MFSGLNNKRLVGSLLFGFASPFYFLHYVFIQVLDND
mgnify:CR=1 FL=1